MSLQCAVNRLSSVRSAGLGMNEKELKRNSALTEVVVRDLNEDPTLPFADASFDIITNVVSVDYLTKPLEIFQEMHRVLKPGGKAIMSFSNRCFPTKAIALWTSTGALQASLWRQRTRAPCSCCSRASKLVRAANEIARAMASLTNNRAGDVDHVWIVGSYYHYSVPGGWTAPQAHDITSPKSTNGRGDPMYIVEATKL